VELLVVVKVEDSLLVCNTANETSLEACPLAVDAEEALNSSEEDTEPVVSKPEEELAKFVMFFPSVVLPLGTVSLAVLNSFDENVETSLKFVAAIDVTFGC